MKTRLCSGDNKKGVPRCIYSEIKYSEGNRPIYAISSRAERFISLNIYCNKQNKYIRKYIISCKDYQNNTLEGIINESNTK